MVVGNQEYDSKAIVGAAHGYQFPESGPLDRRTFSGGKATVKPLLERLGFRIRKISIQDMPFAFAEEVADSPILVEGATHLITVNAYERNAVARKKCISHGAACAVCEMSFGLVYGPEMAGFIHVHHLRPLHEIGDSYEVDPIEHLRPCAQTVMQRCTGGRVRTIDEVRALMNKQANG
ncbi:MAG: hypothetical protein IPG61_09640 [bacterium]|nr:hypothetical protein [bacterium]